jgi:hypothetical protein
MTSGTKKNGASLIPDFGLTCGAFTPDFPAEVEVSTRVAASFRGCVRVAC